MSLRFMAIGDPHLSFSAYGRIGKDGTNFRTQDFMGVFSHVVDEAVKTKPDFVFILGDLYDSPHPPNNIRRFFNAQLVKLCNAGIQTRIITGNHDFCKHHHALEAIMDLGLANVKVVDSPQTEEFNGGKRPVMFMYFPHHFGVERSEIPLRDSFVNFCNVNRKASKRTHEANGGVFLFAHFGVFGSKQSDCYNNQDIRSVTMEELENSGANYVFCGDSHIHQIFPTKKNISMFVGSLERTNSKDIVTPKGYVTYDQSNALDPVYGRCRFINHGKARPFMEITGTPAQIRDVIAGKTIPEGAIVKIACSGTEAEIRAFRADREALEARLFDELKTQYVDMEEVVEPDVEQQNKIMALRDEVAARKTIDSSDIEAILADNIDSKVASEQDRSEIKALVADVIKVVNGRRK